ncbi:TlpA disulfide reductase family protein [Bernardetia sp. ABR2-2B]|uniref:TlpA family protein disulfide reductase n=1 Tax=Bernardetia sp. ABR2-2B TaxID=3127472 RepID=UPI0030CFC8FC
MIPTRTFIYFTFYLFTGLLFSCSAQHSQESLTSQEEFEKKYKTYLSTYPEEQLLSLEVIQDVKNFSVEDITGNSITFGKDSNKPTVLLLFATWCPSCKVAMEEINKKLIQLKGNVQFISIGREHSKEELIEWSKNRKTKMKIVEDENREIFNYFAEEYIPRVYVIDKEGKVIFQDYGWSAETTEMVEEALDLI